ncbi:MAG: c-type cytochrome [Pseudomonadota bacterium]
MLCSGIHRLVAAGVAAVSLLLPGCAGQGPLTQLPCPQPRSTEPVAEPLYSQTSPLPPGGQGLEAAARLYRGDNNFFGCANCHGVRGDGNGPLAVMHNPPPRNFTCAATMDAIPDGQLFAITRDGSPGTAMPSHQELDEEQLWQLVHYIRQFSAGQQPAH